MRFPAPVRRIVQMPTSNMPHDSTLEANPHKLITRLMLGCLVLLAIAPTRGDAHGGVSIEDDRCIMSIGPYRAHFTGYQPKVRGAKEFCEDIPVVADAIIVLDFVSQALRDMRVDFRILRDVNNVGVTATYTDLGSIEDIESATVAYRPSQRYPNGNFDVSLKFDTAGSFIGVLSAVDPGTGREYVSVFPFSVGVVNWWGPLKWVLAVVVLGAGAYFFSPKTTRGA